MQKKYKIGLIIMFIFMLLVALLICGNYYYKNYIKNDSASVVVNEELSINYLNGQKFDFKNSNKEIKFSIINDGAAEAMYHINLLNIKFENSGVKYDLYESEKLVGSNQELFTDNDMTLLNFVQINPGETKSYKLVIKNTTKEKVSFNLEISKVSKEDPNIAQVILNDHPFAKESKTKVGEEIASTDEGLIIDVDDLGNTFYFRGNVNNNYLMFANKLWRIVRINGDGTVKLILNENISTSSIYDDSNTSDKLTTLNKYENTKISTILNQWYQDNLKNYDKNISSEKYCIDTTTEGEILATQFRNTISYNSTFNCLGTNNESKIGLLTVDEVVYAGGIVNGNNSNYYLFDNNISNWWTISPAKSATEGLYYYEVTNSGSISSDSLGTNSKNLRPVINLIKETEITGKGTLEEPYSVK